jgi:hypothetical protein
MIGFFSSCYHMLSYVIYIPIHTYPHPINPSTFSLHNRKRSLHEVLPPVLERWELETRLAKVTNLVVTKRASLIDVANLVMSNSSPWFFDGPSIEIDGLPF